VEKLPCRRLDLFLNFSLLQEGDWLRESRFLEYRTLLVDDYFRWIDGRTTEGTQDPHRKISVPVHPDKEFLDLLFCAGACPLPGILQAHKGGGGEIMDIFPDLNTAPELPEVLPQRVRDSPAV